ncbi:MAG TPA: hypothetical protein VE826_08685 [Dongiaceae bacterium]|nr:hypothetical protein [Dongiaceae bacterium]
MQNKQLVDRINANLRPIRLEFDKISPTRKTIVLTRMPDYDLSGQRVAKADILARFEAADPEFAKAANDLDIVLH